ncbi:NAD(P)H-dependent oxidoreductase [Streptomyces gardneri]|nr:NAD(P)H-dependent oxidoreductase [Streptomyces gardneri]MBF6205665.1 NAD(P)H-dependent oxidoreductase [Streptomyces gardneri]UAK31999.1 NAD(P)H-dependent oxidoreductase [Nocardia asteroides]
MTRIAIILGSTRPGRNGEAVALWVHELAAARDDAEFELVDIAEYRLPHLDEAAPPSLGQYAHEHTKAWAEKIASFDGYVFVTPEYNHSTSGALKNAIDFLYGEWNNKAAGFVSYGSAGGTRAVEHLRLVMGELQVADVRNQVTLSLFTDFEDFSVFAPAERHTAAVGALLDQVVAWSRALASLRTDAKDVVRRNTERVQSGGDFTLFEELFADDFVDHTPQPGTTPDKDGVRVLYHALRTAFPDFSAKIHWQTVDGDVVTTYKTYSGTHRGEFLGLAPTGEHVEFETVDAMRVRDGQITEHWGVANLYSVLQQLGALPAHAGK